LAKANKIAGDKGSMGDDIANISPEDVAREWARKNNGKKISSNGSGKCFPDSPFNQAFPGNPTPFHSPKTGSVEVGGQKANAS